MVKKTVRFGEQAAVPAIGLGTWYMGEHAAQRQQEVAALRAGIDHGLTVIDTAEMYADGGAEEVVGQAIRGLRDRAFRGGIRRKPVFVRPARDACPDPARRYRLHDGDLYGRYADRPPHYAQGPYRDQGFAE